MSLRLSVRESRGHRLDVVALRNGRQAMSRLQAFPEVCQSDTSSGAAETVGIAFRWWPGARRSIVDSALPLAGLHWHWHP